MEHFQNYCFPLVANGKLSKEAKHENAMFVNVYTISKLPPPIVKMNHQTKIGTENLGLSFLRCFTHDLSQSSQVWGPPAYLGVPWNNSRN